MEQTECSETSAYKIQTPGNYPEESIHYSEQGESLKSRIRFVLCRICYVIVSHFQRTYHVFTQNFLFFEGLFQSSSISKRNVTENRYFLSRDVLSVAPTERANLSRSSRATEHLFPLDSSFANKIHTQFQLFCIKFARKKIQRISYKCPQKRRVCKIFEIILNFNQNDKASAKFIESLQYQI